ncbi:penicillin-binding protein activator [Janthinobacterium agaricidamnosum]|uniref:Glycosylase protein n=1 Tax=Janthinobacterium agaricidamnosum NBRC 102515 = DSM 9628 TaxID=1349767 RepID=W0VEF1_9BURK|nr:penicillin-binding protein activator [Janthinobacterium agaricidamnosum]CDG86070.1 glycosylase protein [Janthinobacterium agaricidamnosum NBRC 102515 = DSM 9628]
MARPVLPPRPETPPPPAARTYSVADPDLAVLPDDAPARPSATTPPDGATHHIGLLLPLKSDTLGAAAQWLHDGFMAAYERDHSGFEVSVVDTGDSAQDVLASYAKAQEQFDIIVGPLSRSAVTAVAGSALVRKPTIALNHPEARDDTPLPPQMLVVGLSIEAEARQVAAWAASEQPGASALVLSAGLPWQRRIAAAFSQQWQRQGLASDTLDMTALNGYLSDAELVQLRARIAATPPGLLFVAMDADQARQLRVALGNNIPLYGTSSLNPGVGRGASGPELDGARLLDLPWQVQRDHPAVMVYPQPMQSDTRPLTADMERLYALGIDAFRVAREIALRPAARFTLDGVTGKLSVNFGQGAASFKRSEAAATYQNGVLAPFVENNPAAPANSR